MMLERHAHEGGEEARIGAVAPVGFLNGVRVFPCQALRERCERSQPNEGLIRGAGRQPFPTRVFLAAVRYGCSC